MLRLIANPNPLPEVRVENLGSKMRSRSSEETPSPSSRIVTSTRSAPGDTDTSIRLAPA
jgi:hypothetical protein